ncbi:branched-chain-amino-acid aminotransferase-like protein 2 [Anneissia japonica]|uniref:branched-chain-amino-acid aminotransferase-like protein 2 n=1 Tax=Anneissia japonica TaxID=1529436 RepID=UPI001425AF06|nr:branched-chain-amino-acid aminotransferase-like protein 2 [Anneissia japonica]XP_033125729.1 branched-chain-amino-acid aminotransferase-like protein 2 [Anneissia japonica]XP_033125730.1 branched-chain-amino-acid aminotransferase-like protein 2 [Anneissia japonica]
MTEKLINQPGPNFKDCTNMASVNGHAEPYMNGHANGVAEEKTRVILWTVPRSISTAFERCMGGLDNVELIHEPYVTAYYFGPEKRYHHAPFMPTDEGYSYSDVKKKLEADFEDRDVVFCKDMAYALDDKFEMLPKGYKHTFLIRDPVKAHASMHKLCTKPWLLNYSLIDLVMPQGYAFKQLWDLYEHVTEVLKEDTVVIDADDLLCYPEQVIRRYCTATGLQFNNGMLEWKSNVDITQNWSSSLKLLNYVGVYESAMKSNSFFKHTPCAKRKKDTDVSSLPEDVQKAIEISQPFYDKLYRVRIIPEDLETEV